MSKRNAVLAGVEGAALVWSLSRGESFKEKSVLITGGSKGLGLLLARRFAAEGARLTLLARDETELERAAAGLRSHYKVDVLTVPCDVREREQVREAVRRVLERFGRIDVLVNNAGVIQAGPVAHMDVQDFENAMNIHFWGPLYTMLETVPHMKTQGGGRIVNIASIGGKVAVPHLVPYSASKFALVGLSDGLRAELAQDNIKLTTVCPWLIRTGSYLNVQLKGQHEKELVWFAAADSLPGVSMSAEKAARDIVEACRNGRAQLVTGAQGKLAAGVNALFPEFTAQLLKLTTRLLPGENPKDGNTLQTGWESRSPLAPSLLTTLSDRAARRNNEGRPRG
ncbi:SDR family oxidoreductase [soil metagenome]